MSLTSKALLTAGSRFITIALNTASQFILIPLIIGGLGDALYGIYVVINRAAGMISFADLRPSACLRYVLAQKQSKNLIDQENQYISASTIVAIGFSPVILLATGIIVLLFPRLYQIPQQYLFVALIGIGVIGIRIVLQSILTIPSAILRGNNLEYKLWWTSFVQIIGGFIMMYTAVKLEWGIVGLTAAPVFVSILVGIIVYVIMKNKFPWIGYNRPDKGMLREMTGYGSWYMLNSLAMQLYQSADVLILGIVSDLKTVAYYSVCKAMMYRASESIANLLGAPAAGFGDLIGNHNNEKLIKTREQLLRISLLSSTFIGGGFLLLNKYFIFLWVSENYYLGNTTNLLLVCGAMLLVFSSVDDMILNCILQFKIRFALLSSALIVMVPLCYFLATYWGAAGVALGFLIGKSVFAITTFLFISNHLKISSLRTLVPLLNTLIAMVVLFCLIYLFGGSINFQIDNWFSFIVSSILVSLGLIAYLLIFGINSAQRQIFIKEARNRISKLSDRIKQVT